MLREFEIAVADMNWSKRSPLYSSLCFSRNMRPETSPVVMRCSNISCFNSKGMPVSVGDAGVVLAMVLALALCIGAGGTGAIEGNGPVAAQIVSCGDVAMR